ncbi:MAG: PilZ domain-containing protein [Nitrospira sp.]|jgi:hypothetical protein|nr:PilZ domain-containing protein [Nitrospira sp.]
MPTRRYQRVPLQRPVSLRGTGHNQSGITKDFSPDGCAIQQDTRSLHCGMRLKLQLALPDRQDHLEIEHAIVTWTHNQKCGIRFLDLSPDALARIKNVYDLLLSAQRIDDQEEAPILISLQPITLH